LAQAFGSTILAAVYPLAPQAQWVVGQRKLTGAVAVDAVIVVNPAAAVAVTTAEAAAMTLRPVTGSRMIMASTP